MHPDEAALLKAVCASPADDLPRLVYADWLDEHDRGIRAEFIRGQIELHRLETWFAGFATREERAEHGPKYGRRLGDLRRRIKVLLRDHRAEATGTTGLFLQPHDARYERGFLDSVNLTASKVASSPDGFLGPCPPLVRVYVDYLADWLREYPHSEMATDAWAGVVSVSFGDRFGHGWDTTGIDRLDPSPVPVTLPRVMRLFLDGGQVGDETLGVLLHLFDLPSLTHLSVRDNRLTTASLAHILQADFANRLTSLDVSGNPLDRDAVRLICDRRLPGLQHLNVRYTQVSYGDTLMKRRFEAIYPDAELDV
jgi:uncharacterized protein (TIGR02996 family)